MTHAEPTAVSSRYIFAGAVADALAILPMLVPSLAKFLWGIDAASGPYRSAMGYAASLILGWTVLFDFGCSASAEAERRVAVGSQTGYTHCAVLSVAAAPEFGF
jgi:hypothetical protein